MASNSDMEMDGKNKADAFSELFRDSRAEVGPPPSTFAVFLIQLPSPRETKPRMEQEEVMKGSQCSHRAMFKSRYLMRYFVRMYPFHRAKATLGRRDCPQTYSKWAQGLLETRAGTFPFFVSKRISSLKKMECKHICYIAIPVIFSLGQQNCRTQIVSAILFSEKIAMRKCDNGK